MKTVLAGALVAALTLTTANAADRRSGDDDGFGGVRVGTLVCDIGSGFGYILGSSKPVDCEFRSARGKRENYSGTMRKLGVDVGYTQQGRLVWAVFAPTAGYHRGSLGGLYAGATVEATVGAGVGANVLVGGTQGSVHLQLLSVTGQIGINVAATGTSMTLAAN